MAKPARAKPSNKRKRNPWVRALKWTIGIFLTLGVLGAAGVAVAYSMIQLPDPNADFRTNTTFVYYNDGKTELGSFKVQNRVTIPFEQMNPYVTDAIVAAENRTFWTDPGFDIAALARAARSLVGPEQAVGGSTITQQYIKVMYLTQEKTFTRKAKEILLAVKVGQERTKEQILEGYLNTVYFGRGAYGIEAASQAYFDKPQSELTLAEAVALTAIVNSPGNLDPAAGDKQAADLLERYQYSLNGLVEMGKITDAERLEIYSELPEFPKVKKDSAMGGPKGFLLEMVRKELLANDFSEDQINGGGLRIVTTFDRKAQAAAVKTANTYAREVGGSKKKAEDIHVGLASIDNETGGVLALYGGRDYTENYINWATSPRPVGSTFKPYALAAALRDGWTLEDKVNGSTVTPPDGGRPIPGRAGRISLLSATTRSSNPGFVDLVMQLEDGHDKVVQAAEDAGVPHSKSWDETGYRIPLGTGEISPLNQASGYSTFANQGLHVDPHVVAEVFDSREQRLYAASIAPERGIESDVATDVTYALTKVAQDGTGSRASQLGYPVAGKTGSYYISDLKATRAIWFVGFTRQITTSVMIVKGDQGTGNLGQYFYGSRYPAMAWLDFMKVAMDGKERIAFAQPTRRVSTQSPSPKPSKETEEPSPTPEPTELPSETPTEQPTGEPTPTTPTKAPPTSTTKPTPKPTPTQPTKAPPTTAPPETKPPTTEPEQPGAGEKTET
ncbi:MAG: penicillin-binding protein [Actinobacteria bacterium]|nr:penicillin-binding protein [Actinomycetota bacterium]